MSENVGERLAGLDAKLDAVSSDIREHKEQAQRDHEELKTRITEMNARISENTREIHDRIGGKANRMDEISRDVHIRVDDLTKDVNQNESRLSKMEGGIKAISTIGIIVATLLAGALGVVISQILGQ